MKYGYVLKMISFVLFFIFMFFPSSAQGGDIVTPTPTEVPITSRLDPNDRYRPIVVDLLEFDEDCLLPCFWNFRIDENTTTETSEFVIDTFRQSPSFYPYDGKPLSKYEPDPSAAIMDSYSTFLGFNGGSFQVEFRSVDDILMRMDIRIRMSVNWLEDNPYELSKLLETYGQPSSVFMLYGNAPIVGYTLALVYEEQGFIIEYNFGYSSLVADTTELVESRIMDNGRVLICNGDAAYEGITLTIQKDGVPNPLIDKLLAPYSHPDSGSGFWSIEDMTGLAVEEFTEIFSGNTDTCIEAYSLSELREKGYK